MQNNSHIILPQDMTPTSQHEMSAQVVYPQLPAQQVQMGQPIPKQLQQNSTNVYPVQQYYPQIQPTQQHQVIYNPTAQLQNQPMQSKYPQIITCQYCQRQVQTVVNYEAGNGAYVIGGILAAVGLWLGCCLIPCFMQDCKDAVHFCPSCSAHLGRKKFLFD